MTPSKASFTDYLHLHFLVVLWGFTAILGKLINADLSRVSLTFFRTLLAALGLLMVLRLRREWKTVAPDQRFKMLGIGMLMGIHWLTFFASAHVSSASICLAGMSTTALWTSILEPWVSKRRMSLLEVSMSLLVMVGLYIIFRFEFDQAWGFSLAILSALLAAIFTIANSRFVKNHNALLITFYEMCGGTLAMGVGLMFIVTTQGWDNDALIPQSWDWLWIGILALVCTVYAYSAGIYLLRKITPFTFNLTVNLEPVYGMILAYWILHERMTAGFYAGAGVILLAVVAYPWLKSLRK